jgi:hypothetical protein
MEQELKWTPEPVTIPDNATSFVANGKTYHKASNLSFQRYGWMEALNLEVGYGRTVEQVFKEQRIAFDLLNGQKFAEAAVAIDSSMRGIAAIADGRVHPMMKLTLLFWNYEGENVRTMTEDLMNEKIADMEASGIDFSFFFGQALSTAPGLLSAYRELTEGYSGGMPSASGLSERREEQDPSPLRSSK